VIAYDCDGAREVCREDETGFLIRPGDHATLTDRLLRLARDSDLRERLGRQGQQFVRARFPVQLMVDELYQLYLHLDEIKRISKHPDPGNLQAPSSKTHSIGHGR
jgi:glycosyltransferase involved in cell wall biosynthesis